MEISEHGRVTRATLFVAAFVVAIMLMPGLMIGNQKLSPTDNASAVGTNRVLRIGWPDYYQNIGTLNPHTMTMGQEYMLVYPCYSELLTYDENNQVIGDLATKWTTSADGKDWHFWIVHTASFYDRYRLDKGQALYPLTVDDVMFSFYLTQNNSISIMNYYFPKDPVTNAPLISSMTKVNDFEMIFHLRESFGPFLSALTGVPIVPKYVWDGKAIGWANYDHTTPPCVGSGAYYYALDNIADIQTYGARMIMNPTWFGTIERGWQPHVYEFRVMSETQASGLPNFQQGYLDVLISPTPTQFSSVSEGGPTNIKKFSSSQGFVLDMCINQLTPYTRSRYGMTHGTNNQLLTDPIVKRALKMSVNKDDIVNFSLGGGGSPADSIMPSASVWYYHYGSNPTLDTQYIPTSGDRAGARALLFANGWHYKQDGTNLIGQPDQNTYYPLCQVGGTNVLQFRFEWADWYDFIHDEGIRVQGWAAEAGIDLYTYGGPGTSAQLNSDWKTGDYDIYMWDWWMNPMSEPSLDICELYHTDSIGNNTDVNDYYPPFDDWYYASLRTSDFAARKELVDTMQRWAYENSGYWPTAYRNNLYLVQTTTAQGGQGWTNWGDWVSHYTLCPDSDYWWLFLKIYPASQPAPSITSFSVNPTTTTEALTYTVSVTDNQPSNLQYKWIFGDGTSTSWSSSYAVTKTFTTDGYYDARLVVQETVDDGFMVFARQTVTVIDISNVLPSINAWSPYPGVPTQGELVYFNGSATDANPGDTLAYAWNFGDGTITSGQNVTHKFSSGTGIFSVTLSVDDGHLGTAPRPATRTESLQVVSNGPPNIDVPDYPKVDKAQPYTFSVTASDPNPRDPLKFTWDWGDGSVSVTTTQSTRHTYKSLGSYTLRVWVDDQTGITSPAHNISDTGQIQVVQPSANHAPTMTTSGFGVSSQTPWVGQVVRFWANATDADGDILDIVIDFGDGATSGTITQSDPNATVTATHVYATEDVFFPSVTFTDTIAAAITKFSTDMVPAWYVTTHGVYFDLALLAGWNFVSIPTVSHGYMASTLGLDSGDEIARFNTGAQTYDMPYVVGWPIGDFAIEGSVGYWVYTAVAKPLRVFGEIPVSQQSRSITVPSGGGWAIISITSLSATVMASNIPGMFSGGGSVTEVVYYDPAVPGSYGIYIPGWPFPDFQLMPGHAYWIWCTASGTLSYAP